MDDLASRSRRPHSSPNIKAGRHEEQLILDLRTDRNLGARRIQSELRRLHAISLSLATIHKVLRRNHVKPLKKYRNKKDYVRYERSVPGDRVQMDNCKIGPGQYQYAAIDDCTRYRVLRLYERSTAENTLEFLDCVIDEMPFPIQRIQTDRGREFFATKVQVKLKKYCIKFRPNKPGSPHLDGKIERSHRPHCAHHGKSPMERYFDMASETPLSEEAYEGYNPDSERIQDPNYSVDLELQRLKRSL